jgi:pathogenesis-related protein 1
MLFTHFSVLLLSALYSLLLVSAHPTHQSRAIASSISSQFLQAHNNIRAQHGAKGLAWSQTLADKAQEWANQCDFSHSQGSLMAEAYGENIAAATGTFTPTAAVNTFISDAGAFLLHCEGCEKE